VGGLFRKRKVGKPYLKMLGLLDHVALQLKVDLAELPQEPGAVERYLKEAAPFLAGLEKVDSVPVTIELFAREVARRGHDPERNEILLFCLGMACVHGNELQRAAEIALQLEPVNPGAARDLATMAKLGPEGLKMLTKLV